MRFICYSFLRAAAVTPESLKFQKRCACSCTCVRTPSFHSRVGSSLICRALSLPTSLQLLLVKCSLHLRATARSFDGESFI
eukprot:3429068-Pleurochrysis_carterae.AAC.1